MGDQSNPTTLWSIGCALVLTGCSGASALHGLTSLQQPLGQVSDTCSSVLSRTQDAISIARVQDNEASSINGFPHLRVNRFLAHLGSQLDDRKRTPEFDTWASRLRKLGVESERNEIMNLPAPERKRLLKLLPNQRRTTEKLISYVRECNDRKHETVLANSERRTELLERAVVPDSYSEVARAAGAYPLMALPVSQGWDRWRQDNLGTFEQQASALATTGELLEFTSKKHPGALPAKDVRQIIERSRDKQFGIPEPQGNDLTRLLAAFAPVWQIDTTGDYDRIGHPMWTSSPQKVKIDLRRPTVFTRISHVTVNNRVLLQLVYGIWFSERPVDGPLDLLGGKLDGLIWRVTFGEDGSPIMYDSIHGCGCYHLFFPVSGLRNRPAVRGSETLYEQPAVLHTAPDLQPGQSLVLRIATRSHYLNQVTLAAGKTTTKQIFYEFSDEANLRSLPVSKGTRRSLFGADGLVAESERLERYILWPMGIASAGAMRQWGHHATAFVGKRHFDDPELIQKMFYRSNETANY